MAEYDVNVWPNPLYTTEVVQAQTVTKVTELRECQPRSSTRELRIRVPFFSISVGEPSPKSGSKGTTGGPLGLSWILPGRTAPKDIPGKMKKLFTCTSLREEKHHAQKPGSSQTETRRVRLLKTMERELSNFP